MALLDDRSTEGTTSSVASSSLPPCSIKCPCDPHVWTECNLDRKNSPGACCLRNASNLASASMCFVQSPTSMLGTQNKCIQNGGRNASWCYNSQNATATRDACTPNEWAPHLPPSPGSHFHLVKSPGYDCYGPPAINGLRGVWDAGQWSEEECAANCNEQTTCTAYSWVPIRGVLGRCKYMMRAVWPKAGIGNAGTNDCVCTPGGKDAAVCPPAWPGAKIYRRHDSVVGAPSSQELWCCNPYTRTQYWDQCNKYCAPCWTQNTCAAPSCNNMCQIEAALGAYPRVCSQSDAFFKCYETPAGLEKCDWFKVPVVCRDRVEAIGGACGGCPFGTAFSGPACGAIKCWPASPLCALPFEDCASMSRPGVLPAELTCCGPGTYCEPAHAGPSPAGCRKAASAPTTTHCKNLKCPRASPSPNGPVSTLCCPPDWLGLPGVSEECSRCVNVACGPSLCDIHPCGPHGTCRAVLPAFAPKNLSAVPKRMCACAPTYVWGGPIGRAAPGSYAPQVKCRQSCQIAPNAKKKQTGSSHYPLTNSCAPCAGGSSLYLGYYGFDQKDAYPQCKHAPAPCRQCYRNFKSPSACASCMYTHCNPKGPGAGCATGQHVSGPSYTDGPCAPNCQCAPGHEAPAGTWMCKPANNHCDSYHPWCNTRSGMCNAVASGPALCSQCFNEEQHHPVYSGPKHGWVPAYPAPFGQSAAQCATCVKGRCSPTSVALNARVAATAPAPAAPAPVVCQNCAAPYCLTPAGFCILPPDEVCRWRRGSSSRGPSRGPCAGPASHWGPQPDGAPCATCDPTTGKCAQGSFMTHRLLPSSPSSCVSPATATCQTITRVPVETPSCPGPAACAPMQNQCMSPYTPTGGYRMRFCGPAPSGPCCAEKTGRAVSQPFKSGDGTACVSWDGSVVTPVANCKTCDLGGSCVECDEDFLINYGQCEPGVPSAYPGTRQYLGNPAPHFIKYAPNAHICAHKKVDPILTPLSGAPGAREIVFWLGNNITGRKANGTFGPSTDVLDCSHFLATTPRSALDAFLYPTTYTSSPPPQKVGKAAFSHYVKKKTTSSVQVDPYGEKCWYNNYTLEKGSSTKQPHQRTNVGYQFFDTGLSFFGVEDSDWQPTLTASFYPYYAHTTGGVRNVGGHNDPRLVPDNFLDGDIIPCNVKLEGDTRTNPGTYECPKDYPRLVTKNGGFACEQQSGDACNIPPMCGRSGPSMKQDGGPGMFKSFNSSAPGRPGGPDSGAPMAYVSGQPWCALDSSCFPYLCETAELARKLCAAPGSACRGINIVQGGRNLSESKGSCDGIEAAGERFGGTCCVHTPDAVLTTPYNYIGKLLRGGTTNVVDGITPLKQEYLGISPDMPSLYTQMVNDRDGFGWSPKLTTDTKALFHNILAQSGISGFIQGPYGWATTGGAASSKCTEYSNLVVNPDRTSGLPMCAKDGPIAGCGTLSFWESVALTPSTAPQAAVQAVCATLPTYPLQSTRASNRTNYYPDPTAGSAAAPAPSFVWPGYVHNPLKSAATFTAPPTDLNMLWPLGQAGNNNEKKGWDNDVHMTVYNASVLKAKEPTDHFLMLQQNHAAAIKASSGSYQSPAHTFPGNTLPWVGKPLIGTCAARKELLTSPSCKAPVSKYVCQGSSGREQALSDCQKICEQTEGCIGFNITASWQYSTTTTEEGFACFMVGRPAEEGHPPEVGHACKSNAPYAKWRGYEVSRAHTAPCVRHVGSSCSAAPGCWWAPVANPYVSEWDMMGSKASVPTSCGPAPHQSQQQYTSVMRSRSEAATRTTGDSSKVQPVWAWTRPCTDAAEQSCFPARLGAFSSRPCDSVSGRGCTLLSYVGTPLNQIPDGAFQHDPMRVMTVFDEKFPRVSATGALLEYDANRVGAALKDWEDAARVPRLRPDINPYVTYVDTADMLGCTVGAAREMFYPGSILCRSGTLPREAQACYLMLGACVGNSSACFRAAEAQTVRAAAFSPEDPVFQIARLSNVYYTDGTRGGYGEPALIGKSLYDFLTGSGPSPLTPVPNDPVAAAFSERFLLAFDMYANLCVAEDGARTAGIVGAWGPRGAELGLSAQNTRLPAVAMPVQTKGGAFALSPVKPRIRWPRCVCQKSWATSDRWLFVTWRVLLWSASPICR